MMTYLDGVIMHYILLLFLLYSDVTIDMLRTSCKISDKYFTIDITLHHTIFFIALTHMILNVFKK